MLKGATETLDSKQSSLFKQLVKLYETKQYKKGLRQADILLEQKPGHAETMSMKAIFMYFTGEKTEALDLSKKALYKNMKSDIAWHIYGIIHRSNRNYQEAINCYKKALDYAPENVQILRDLALLQAQIRDVEGLSETRRKLLLNKDSLIINWVAYAFSLHLKGAADESLKVIQSIQNIQKNNPLKGVEKSEFSLYHAQVYGDNGELEMQLKTLETNEAEIIDKTALSEMKAQVLLKLGRTDAAVVEVEKLIEMNPYNKNWYNLLKTTSGLPAVPTNEDERAATSKFFDEISQKYKTNIVSYMALQFATGEDFEKKLTAYITPYIRKAIPSLFSELKHLYSEKWRVAVIEKILLSQAASLQSDGKFVGSEKSESPTCLLWAFMLLAQHFDKVGQLETAVEYINKAINHTPTLVELYLVKAKILKHQFNHVAAFELTEKARKMDLADRYLNNKSIKYALRCGQDDLANELLRLFLKDPTEGNPFELQSLWFEIAQGEILLKRGEYTKALRMFKFVHRAFIEVFEDQFDFHTYCIRRYNLNTYSRLIAYESNVYNQKSFIQGATLLLRSLLEYVPIQIKEIKDKEDEVLRIKNMSQMEKKKYKKQQELDAANAAKDPLADFRKKHDLEGEEFRNSKPLVEANLVARTLVHTSTSDSQLAYQSAVALLDFYIETNRPMLVIKALNRGISSNWCANGSHVLRVKTAVYLQNYLKGDKLNETIKKYAEETLNSILQGKSVEEFNAAYHSSNGASVPAFKNALAKLKSDIALGKTPSTELRVFLKESLLTHTDLQLADAARLYDEFIKQSGFQEDAELSAKLQKQFPNSEYYFTLSRFTKREDGVFQSLATVAAADAVLAKKQ